MCKVVSHSQTQPSASRRVAEGWVWQRKTMCKVSAQESADNIEDYGFYF